MSNELIPTTEEMQTIESLAKHALQSKFFEKMGGVGGMVTIMLYAKEIGMSPMQALFGGMHNVMGKIEISPMGMNALIRKAGHRIDIIRHDHECCEIKGTRKETGETATVRYSILDAKRAGIYKEGSGWTKYPEDMLWARAVSRLCRRLFPDVIGPMYVEGEIESSKKDISVTNEESISYDEIVLSPEESTDLTVDQSAEILEKEIGVTNDSNLKDYISSRMATTKNSLNDVTKKWIENREKFISYYNNWIAKREEFSNASR